MQGFRSAGGLQRFITTFSAIRNLFVAQHRSRSALATHIHRVRAIGRQGQSGVLAKSVNIWGLALRGDGSNPFKARERHRKSCFASELDLRLAPRLPCHHLSLSLKNDARGLEVKPRSRWLGPAACGQGSKAYVRTCDVWIRLKRDQERDRSNPAGCSHHQQHTFGGNYLNKRRWDHVLPPD